MKNECCQKSLNISSFFDLNYDKSSYFGWWCLFKINSIMLMKVDESVFSLDEIEYFSGDFMRLAESYYVVRSCWWFDMNDSNGCLFVSVNCLIYEEYSKICTVRRLTRSRIGSMGNFCLILCAAQHLD